MNIQNNSEDEFINENLHSPLEADSQNDSESLKDDIFLSSIQDVSKKLSIPENTIRKYLTYFELPVEKVGRKTCLTDESIQCLSEILQFKSNGLSLKQIKALRDGSNEGDLFQDNSPIISQQNINQDISHSAGKEFEQIEESLHIHELAKDQSNQDVELKNLSSIEENLSSTSSQSNEPQFTNEGVSNDAIELGDSSGNGLETLHQQVSDLELDGENLGNEYIEKEFAEKEFPGKIYSEQDYSEEINPEFSNQIINSSEGENKNPFESNEPDSFQQESQLQEPFHQDSHNRGPRRNNPKQNTQRSADYREPLSKDLVNREIATQSKRASRLYRFLSSRISRRDAAEIQADLNRRVEFINGLRYLRDNWLTRRSGEETHQQNRNDNRYENDFKSDRQSLVEMN
jgi:DNA-binding transcriptional MerR regulator